MLFVKRIWLAAADKLTMGDKGKKDGKNPLVQNYFIDFLIGRPTGQDIGPGLIEL